MNGFDGIRVVGSSLEQASMDMQTANKQIENRMQNLEHELSPLRDGWTGAAKNAYADAKLKWDQAIVDMQGLLQQTQQCVTQSNQDYDLTDNTCATYF